MNVTEIIKHGFEKKLSLYSFIFCYFLCVGFVNSQDLKQLKNDLTKSMHDTSRLNVLAQLVELEEDGVWQKYNLQRKFLAKKNRLKFKSNPTLYNKYSFELADALYDEGVDYFNQSKLVQAMELQRKSLKLYEELNEEAKKADPLSEISKIYTLNGDLKKAIESFYVTLRIYEKNKNYSGVADCYAGLGEIYSNQSQLDLSIESNKFAVKYYALSKQYDGLCIALCEISDCLMTQKKFDEAKYYLNQTEKYKSRLKNYELALIELQNGVLAEELFETKKAINYFKKSLTLYELDNEANFICTINFLLGRIFFVQEKDSKSALFHAEKSLALALEIDFSYDIERSTLLLYEINKSIKQTEKSLFYLEKYVTILSNKNSNEVKNTLFQEQVKYNFEKKELLSKAKAEKASFRKNVWIISIASLILIIGIFGFFNFRITKQKKTIAEQKSNILKQKLLVSQMNPHFIFNSLNAIQNCIFKEDGLTAGTYLAQFADLMRMILDFSRKDTISLESEISLLENYLQLQQFRFNNKFEYKLIIDPELNPSQVEIPPMLAQPFIENAIEHGIFHLKENGFIQIRIFKHETNLRFEIEDNGIGLKQSEKLKPKLKKHNSLATIITQERINELFLDKKTTSLIEINDLCLENENFTGVKVVFEIPVKIVTK